MQSTVRALILLLSCAAPLSALVIVVPSGLVRTTTVDIPAIGDSAIIKEGGSIIVTGVDAVTVSAANQSVLNQGRISTLAGGTGRGIFTSTNANALVINRGLISTAGINSPGIFNEGTSASIQNSGLISTSGGGTGILNHGANSVITNSGQVFTTGINSVGLEASSGGGNSVIINSGLVSTSANASGGISSASNNVVLKNSGLVVTRGSLSDGIGGNGNNIHVINSGTVRVLLSDAISLGGSAPTISLLKGSNLQGPVTVTNPVTLNVETGLNLALTLDAGSFAAFGITAPFALLGQTAGVIDPTGLAMQADVVADLSDTILDGIYRHKLAFPCSCLPYDCGLWAQGIGSTRKRSKDSDHVGYDNWQGGFLIGYDTPLCEGNVNVFGGISFGEATVDQETQKADTTSYVGGVAYERIFCNTFLGLAFAAGYVDWNNDRFVMNNLTPGGIDTAKADTGGVLISPEVTLAQRLAALRYNPILSFTLRYAGLFLGDYQEEGSLTDLFVRDRTVNLLTTRFEVAIPYTDAWGLCCWSIEPYVGVFGRYQLSSNTVNAELLGQSLCFDPGNPHNLGALLVGFRGIQNLDHFNLFLNVEASFDIYESTRILGEGGIGFSF